MNPTRISCPRPTFAFEIEAPKKRAPPERMKQADG
jgi:hypothetical protein